MNAFIQKSYCLPMWYLSSTFELVTPFKKEKGGSVGPQLPILLENGSRLEDWYFKSCLEDEEWKSFSPKCWPIVDLIRGPHKQESQKGQLTWLTMSCIGGKAGNARFLQLFVAYLTADLSKRWWTNLAGLNSWLQFYCTSFWSYNIISFFLGKGVSQLLVGNFRHDSAGRNEYIGLKCMLLLEFGLAAKYD